MRRAGDAAEPGLSLIDTESVDLNGYWNEQVRDIVFCFESFSSPSQMEMFFLSYEPIIQRETELDSLRRSGVVLTLVFIRLSGYFLVVH